MAEADPRRSLALTVAALPAADRERALAALAPTPEEAWALLWDWGFWARPDQLEPPGDWFVWLMLTGKGWGKSRTAAEWVRSKVERGVYGLWNFVARTRDDYREVMVEGPAGILRISPPDSRPTWIPTRRTLVWPNGARALLFAAEEPDQLLGKSCEAGWADEVAAWQYDQAWDNLEFDCRLGEDPRIVAATTPKPRPLIRRLKDDPRVVVTGGSTYDNAANLAPGYIRRLIGKYEGSRLAGQEIHGRLIEDAPGALWRREWIDGRRTARAPELRRVVVGVDPPGSEEGAEAGIVVAGAAAHPDGRDHAYVLGDLSLHGSPARWGREVLRAWHRHGADRIVAEVNQGGDMVVHTIRTAEYAGEPQGELPGGYVKGANVAVKKIRAKRGKRVRAEPVAALYEQGRVHHVGVHADLEDQLCKWDPEESDESPDRLDALVYAVTELLLGKDVAWAL